MTHHSGFQRSLLNNKFHYNNISSDAISHWSSTRINEARTVMQLTKGKPTNLCRPRHRKESAYESRPRGYPPAATAFRAALRDPGLEAQCNISLSTSSTNPSKRASDQEPAAFPANFVVKRINQKKGGIENRHIQRTSARRNSS